MMYHQYSYLYTDTYLKQKQFLFARLPTIVNLETQNQVLNMIKLLCHGYIYIYTIIKLHFAYEALPLPQNIFMTDPFRNPQLWLYHPDLILCIAPEALELLINDYRKYKRCILITRLVEGHVKQIAFGHTFNRWKSFVMWGGCQEYNTICIKFFFLCVSL